LLSNLFNTIPFFAYKKFESLLLSIGCFFFEWLLIDKTQFIQFLTKNSELTDLSISYENKHIIKGQKVKFLGLTIDNYVMEFPYRRNNTQIKSNLFCN